MMRLSPLSVLGNCGFAMAAAAVSFAGAALAGKVHLKDWATVQNARYGFSLSYPGNVFEIMDGKVYEDGVVAVSRDGNARLAVATFENEDSLSLEEYRQHILANNYDGARIEFAPQRKSWFIVSGTRGDVHFYERVSFTCQGRFINSWALLYPVAERPFYDRVVEAVARSYTPGEGRSGRCE